MVHGTYSVLRKQRALYGQGWGVEALDMALVVLITQILNPRVSVPRKNSGGAPWRLPRWPGGADRSLVRIVCVLS